VFVDFSISVDIAASPGIVWAVMSDAERWHEWTASVTSIRLLDRGPLAVGSRALIRQPRFPPALWKVTAITPGHSFTWRSGVPAAWVHATHSVAPVGAGTRATLSLHYEGPLGRLLGRMTRDITNRYLQMEAAGLKARSEERLVRGPRHERPANRDRS
jgi:hypothetical protein